jgi:branched-chain amino acid transport system permease protein
MLRGFVSPELMFFMTSGNGVISTLLGGTGTLVGAVYGSVLLVVIKSAVGSWTEHHLVVIGLLFMGSVLFLPRGLLGVIHPWLQHALSPKAPLGDVRRHVPIPDAKS